jgi:hypothetical protein
VRLTEAVTGAVADPAAPTAVLALTYAASIDEATHAPLGLAEALERLSVAAGIADEQMGGDALGDSYGRAFRKVAAALSAVSVASDLGPKLLDTLDALLITPKARAAIGDAVTPPADSPLDRLRGNHDNRRLRSVV